MVDIHSVLAPVVEAGGPSLALPRILLAQADDFLTLPLERWNSFDDGIFAGFSLRDPLLRAGFQTTSDVTQLPVSSMADMAFVEAREDDLDDVDDFFSSGELSM